ncbi:DUF4041 domain-containing protein [Lacticaseibacillus sharpeae]|uniref:Bacteriophage T5 Orf172 DNA-binding domain-containing protein n=1 Tax=Lacticaseibacillus sharpeae JCM 1186 = DSM 20505 TaxID=1291052 RepID=A0A0R1ZJR2_9LACO|nr:DUF4041 domain-containing protein [Lacticaseibacillus sharpeae]KRM54594.1 hypothetical protein FC18_GL002301 [Lacticaseibacillus sharpeae JCM 1186 = DSM 20505]
MGFGDMFKAKEFKAEIDRLQADNAELKQQNSKLNELNQRKIALEAMPAEQLDAEIVQLTQTRDKLASALSSGTETAKQLQSKLVAMTDKKTALEKEILVITDDVAMQDFGLYRPQYAFANALDYKDKLADIRAQQKQMIKNSSAGNIFRPMTLDGSSSKGRSMQNKNIKQLLRSFNGECEAAIGKVTYSNFDRVVARINKSFEQLNKLNDPNGVRLTEDYRNLKQDELHLAFEYANKKQVEKEELREQREREREEKQAQKEIADKQKQLLKDLNHYQKALSELQEKMESQSGQDRADTEKAIAEMQAKIDESEAQQKDLDYRKEHATAGYVYIISNIGSFGEDVVKIGVTRRLDPMDRIDELGSASVPFKFDVHALIFSYDAYALEADLHKRFEKQRINKVNMRKEYFKIPIEQVESVLEEYKDLTVDFNARPEAPEYRQSLALEN